ncbi:probable cytochrome P450 6d4, partial [Contarinia nasturtii]|uniref:probable cytochrome P450 6d4 n=1 Tax=Contarinia nasturtii TaxID=265458 RepID=UPI0012D39763
MFLFDILRIDVIFVLVGALTSIYLYLKRTYSYWDRRGFKTFAGYDLIFGHFTRIIFQKEHICNFLLKLYSTTTDPFIAIYGIFRPILVIRDPELIRLILIKNFAHFTDRGIHCNERYNPVTGNLVALQGQRWKQLRAKLTPAFTNGKLKAMFPTLINCGMHLQDYLEKVADNDKMLNVREICAGFTTNIIASVAFGIDVDSLHCPNNDFRKYGRKIFEPSFFNALRRLMRFIAPNVMNILRIKSIKSEIEDFFISIVKENLECREKNNITRKDFFQLMIQLRNNGTVQLDDDQWKTIIQTDENRKTMTLNEIAANTFIFFSAGFESSSNIMSFCLYELAMNTQLQKRAHNEIDHVLNEYNGQITFDSISAMKFLGLCIDETIRKYPIAIYLSRNCVKDYRIPETNQIIEKGTGIMIPLYALHMDEKYYDMPQKFDPDRFNEENSMGKNQLNRPYMPFGEGPRSCIAMRLGSMQIKVGLIVMLQKYRFEIENK